MRSALVLSFSLLVISSVGCGKVTESGAGGGADAGNGGRVTCEVDQDCPIDQPVCDLSVGLCSPCTSSDQCTWRVGNTQCETGSGSCVSCTEDLHCAAGAPFCDQEEFLCRGCVDNSECGSGLCDYQSATCADPDDIVWVENGAAADPVPPCGERPTPCSSPSEGFGVAGDIVAPRKYVVILPAGTYENPGNGAQIRQDTYVSAENAAFGATFVADTDASGVVWIGGTFEGDDEISASIDPLTCNPGGELTVVGASFSNYRAGVSATACRLNVFASFFTANTSGINTRSVDSSRIEGNRFEGNDDTAMEIHAIGIDIRNNRFVGNGIGGAEPTVQLSTDTDNPSRIRFSFNSMAGNISPAATVSCPTATGDIIISSNIIYFNEAAAPLACSGYTILRNIMDVPDLSPLLANNSNEDPLFVNIDDDDLHLGPSSPAIDQGGVLEAPPVDIEGIPRSSGAGPDIGAYERN